MNDLHHRSSPTGSLAGLLCLAALLAACGVHRADTGSPAAAQPPATDAQRIANSIPTTGLDLSVPDAATVLAEAPPSAAVSTAQDKPLAAPNATLTPAQESSAMPMPGQANTHGTPSTKPGAP